MSNNFQVTITTFADNYTDARKDLEIIINRCPGLNDFIIDGGDYAFTRLDSKESALKLQKEIENIINEDSELRLFSVGVEELVIGENGQIEDCIALN